MSSIYPSHFPPVPLFSSISGEIPLPPTCLPRLLPIASRSPVRRSSRECEFLGWNLASNVTSTELIGFVSPPPSFPDPLFRWEYHESRGRSNFVWKRERKRRERFQDCIDNKKGVNWFRRKNINLFGDSGGFIGVVPSGPIPRDERLFLWHRSVFTKWTGYFECAGVYSIRITVSLDCIMV